MNEYNVYWHGTERQVQGSNEILGMEMFAETEKYYPQKNKISITFVRAAFNKIKSKQIKS